jgi:hypothetical protein
VFAAMAQDLVGGQIVAEIAGPGDPHGSSWSGPHLHYGTGPGILCATSGTTYNPLPLVEAVLGGTSGGGTTPIPVWKDDTMFRIVKEANADPIWIVGASGKRARIATTQHADLLRRLFKSTNGDDPMLLAEIDICASYLRAVDATDTIVGAAVDVAAIAAAVDVALADDFAEVNANVDAIVAGSPTDIQPLLDALALLPAATIDELKARL